MAEIQIPRWNRIRAEEQATEAAASFSAGVGSD